jgi:hypothetical protein
MDFIKLLTILVLFVGVTSFAQQEPLTNAPGVIYPLFDDYIKEGYERNYRTHTRQFNRISYIYVGDISHSLSDNFYVYEIFGRTSTYKVYKVDGFKRFHYNIAINSVWGNNYITMRRIFYKVIGFSQGLRECHHKCKHIMSGRPLLDPYLTFHDITEDYWERELDYYFKQIDAVSK